MKEIRAAFGLLAVVLSACSRGTIDSTSDNSSPLPAVPFEALAQQKQVIDGGSGGGSTGDTFDSNGGLVRQMHGPDEIDYTYDTHLQVTEQKILLGGGSMGTVAQQNVYDGDGNQIAFYSATVTYTYVTAQVRTVSRNNGAPVALVSYEDSETDENGRLEQMVKDHLGSVVAMVDAQDGFRMVKDQLPFGASWYERTVASYSNPTDKGFNGNRDEGFKNYGVERLNYNARHYAPEIGKFLQADTVTPEDGATVINWNRYVYVNNDPLNAIDPTGHKALDYTLYEPIDPKQVALSVIGVNAILSGIRSKNGFLKGALKGALAGAITAGGWRIQGNNAGNDLALFAGNQVQALGNSMQKNNLTGRGLFDHFETAVGPLDLSYDRDTSRFGLTLSFDTALSLFESHLFGPIGRVNVKQSLLGGDVAYEGKRNMVDMDGVVRGFSRVIQYDKGFSPTLLAHEMTHVFQNNWIRANSNAFSMKELDASTQISRVGPLDLRLGFGMGYASSPVALGYFGLGHTRGVHHWVEGGPEGMVNAQSRN